MIYEYAGRPLYRVKALSDEYEKYTTRVLLFEGKVLSVDESVYHLEIGYTASNFSAARFILARNQVDEDNIFIKLEKMLSNVINFT